MAKIKQIKPSDRKKLYPYMDEKELPNWDPTWCYPDDDEKMMIAAWDCWDINHNTFERSSTTSLIESSSKTDIQKYFDLTNCDNKPITKFNQPKVSKPIQASNAKGLVDMKISFPKDDLIHSDNYEKTLKYIETSQRETLIKSDGENHLHKFSAKNDTTLIFEDSKSLNLTSAHEESTNPIKEISNPSNNMMQQMKIVKEHREYEYNKKEENISFQSQPVSVLIDLNGLDDWLNKTTTSKNNQLEQKWYQTEADKTRKNNFNLNDKVSYEDLLEFDLLMQK
ncbi:hypothetical protein GLOIN_2v1785335 [Rhizophagus irregularis DAOM 181602=DAOM 197198]|uniref:Uncharacterized protein n=1 Tax=Rhizophagus irregularis (strain DAOM 181602 / DAOM 197198 / MUCL 43194) TaxID=747089 RepID=U9SFW9_RHIID|nr:hypothetical protein GLOIN_2v1785335 [Rhizophagus irregularis DAOM 181602=DAOM 197198]POG62425.1 hypothetical protein GLOIN_2v1785335 [Rhizophagus irregularis DAOM 181602=DAOM 197198]|eukprot:XP_025169291.1 hypothetical protein GLOIN_2v1785335 [Rhizophagus irregularis DAOM 181602=DAOM 197198]